MQVVTTSPLVRKYSLEEFWALPEPKDGSKLELIAGVLYMSPRPDFPHNFSSATLNSLFYLHVSKVDAGGMVFTPRAALWTGANTYVEPDLFYVTAQTLTQLDWKRPHTADLVVEIISPGSAIYDRNTKADTYAPMGVREMWLVDPPNVTVEVRNLDQTAQVYGVGQFFTHSQRVASQVLPGFAPDVDEICRMAPRKS